MRQFYKPCVIMALNTGDIQKEVNIFNALGLNSKVLEGSYKGQKETSHLIVFNSPNQLQDLINLAKTYKQESILIRDSNNAAELFYLKTGVKVPLGHLKLVSKAYALQKDNYTHDLSNNTYWVCE